MAKTDVNCALIALNKPSNYDSHQVTALLKRMLNVNKIGHSGTLDPKVTGVLIVFLNRATRLATYLFGSDKEYIGIMYLHKDISIKELREVIKKKFTGVIKQIPPVKSAVKRQEREREVYSFKILEKDGKEVLFSIKCESGTYVRKIISDLGEELKIGAHMLELRRIREGIFEEKDCVNMYDIAKAIKEEKVSKILLPPEIITKNMPKITINKKYLDKVYNGSPILNSYILKKEKFKKGEIVAVFSNKRLIEISQVVNEEGVIAKPLTVLKY